MKNNFEMNQERLKELINDGYLQELKGIKDENINSLDESGILLIEKKGKKYLFDTEYYNRNYTLRGPFKIIVKDNYVFYGIDEENITGLITIKEGIYPIFIFRKNIVDEIKYLCSKNVNDIGTYSWKTLDYFKIKLNNKYRLLVATSGQGYVLINECGQSELSNYNRKLDFKFLLDNEEFEDILIEKNYNNSNTIYLKLNGTWGFYETDTCTYIKPEYNSIYSFKTSRGNYYCLVKNNNIKIIEINHESILYHGEKRIRCLKENNLDENTMIEDYINDFCDSYNDKCILTKKL